MLKKSKNLLIISVFSAILAIGFFAQTSFASSGVNLTLFGQTLGNRIIPNCVNKPEYNEILKQWSVNEVCSPTVVEFPSVNYDLTRQNNNAYTGLQYITYPATSYYSNPINSRYNNTSNYGTPFSASQYLLSSFGGGYGGGYSGSLTAPYYNYGGYRYPNSVGYYTPSVSEYYYSTPTYYTETYYDDYDTYDSYDSYDSYHGNSYDGGYDYSYNYSYDDGGGSGYSDGGGYGGDGVCYDCY